MKVKYLPVIVFLGAFSLLISSYNDGYTHGSDLGAGGDDRTGASLPTIGCGGNGCHSSVATAGITVTVELDSAGVSVNSYRAGGSYTVKLTGTNTTANNLPLFGFALSAVKTTGAGVAATAVSAGSWGTLPTAVQVSPTATATLVVEHQSPAGPASGTGATGTTYVRNIPWTAPAAGTGSVSFYGVINAVNGDNIENTNDKWNNTSKIVTEATTGPNGINDMFDKVAGFNVYPTLMNSNVTVAFDLKEASAVNIQMISMQGQVVKTLIADESFSEGAVNRSYDMTGLSAGIYFVRMQIGNSSVVSKVVKQ